MLNRRPTQRAADAGDSAAISSSFLRLVIFLVGRLRRPRPSAGNAIRWAFGIKKDVIYQNQMIIDDFQEIAWLEPWYFDHSGLELELSREVSVNHPLYGVKAVAIGRRRDNDDVLFFLLEHQPPLAVVHLTWRQEDSPDWPFTLFYDSVDDFILRRMKTDWLDNKSSGKK